MIIPEAFAGTNADVYVAGATADSVDFRDHMYDRAPYVFAFVLGLSFLLLLVMFRSIVIPLKAIVLNLLSVGAAYGVLVMVFQWGWGISILGSEASGIVESWLPLFLFGILFGLSMDYHMLLLNRIKEVYDEGESNEAAVSLGIRLTAGQITSAAAIMVGVFAAFASSRILGAPAVRGRFGGCGVHRRHGHPGNPAAGQHEAAGRLQLVLAKVARLAAEGDATGRARGRRSIAQGQSTPRRMVSQSGWDLPIRVATGTTMETVSLGIAIGAAAGAEMSIACSR